MKSSRWSTGFSVEQLHDAENLLIASETSQPGDEHRVDLRHLHCVTIDDPETSEIDDALSLERRPNNSLRIWIHIADPGRLITAGSTLDNEAAARGSSLYLARGNEPMFPQALANGPFSLRAGHTNAAWSTWVELTSEGAIDAYGVTRSWVKPLYKLSYDDADELIDLAPPEDPDLADLNALLQCRKQWRQRNGALVMELPEGRIRCRNDDATLEITEPSPSRLMVAEAMILAGAVNAQYGIDHGLPLPYRSQPPADLPSPAELHALPEGAVRFAAIKRCLRRGLMGTQPAAHFSLGLPAYVQATSPIRRYSDLIVQRQIQAHQDGTTTLTEDELQNLLSTVELATREGLGISREDQRYWQQVWFEQHRHKRWQADFLRWLRPQDRLGLIRIDALALDLAAKCPIDSEPGDPLQVVVQMVDPIRDQLRLQAH
ncbi:MAG: ribonuclease catalytic domain-containing protein [Synechococcus sp.]